MTLPDQLSAQITLTGQTMDLIGGLYLAYDLLGGDKGPLSTLTRVVTYSLMMVILLSLPMGLKFGLPAGIGLGIALGLHLERIGRGQKETAKFLFAVGLLRATGIYLAALWDGSPGLAACAFPLVLVASIILPKLKLSPAYFYEAGKKPSFGWRKFLLACVMGIMAAGAGVVTAFLQHDSSHIVMLVLKPALTLSMAMMVITTVTPLIEWYADNIPGKTMGYLGTTLFVVGFAVQAIPSLVTVLR